MNSLFSLEGKVILLTGATGHLGQAIADGLASSGASLALCSTSERTATQLADGLSDRYGVKALGYELDLQCFDKYNETVARLVRDFGQLDGLVNNAYFGLGNVMEDMTPPEWAKGLEGAVSSPFILMQACLSLLEETDGSVVNIGSMYGMVSPKPRNYNNTPFGSPINYGAGKAALLQMTRYSAVYLGPKGIRVNAVSPGPFPAAQAQELPEFIGNLERDVPLGRIGRPEEISGAVVFLLSSASSFVTGHNLVVDGGWTVW